ncbi:Mov34/MPN/PAD-1 family protein, partial [Candidatus Margulisiibacteriota bacterium]
MIESFAITQRHYDLIVEQAQKNFPQEVGGFLGGNEEGQIQGILPLFNMFLFDKTGTFVITGDDLERAHGFFAKHNLQYYGLYHSHPQGAPYPSIADINSRQKYHFILGLSDINTPILNAFEVINK